MGVMRNLSVSLVASLAYFFSSFFLNLVPCQISPNVPNPTYAWTFCNINPDQTFSLGIQKLYFGFTSTLTETYFISLAAVFLIVLGILTLLTKKSKRNKDE